MLASFIYLLLFDKNLRVGVGNGMIWTHYILDKGIVCFSRMMVDYRPGFKNFVKSSGS